jgi:hypothetical protein
VAERRKKAKKRVAISGWLLTAQMPMLVAAIWLVCAEWAPLAANDSPIQLIAKALLYLTLAWLGSFGMTLWTYLAISLDETVDLVRTAMQVAVHALWFVPGMLLVSPPADRTVTAIGTVVIANAARLFVSHPPPQRRTLSRRNWRMTHRLFGESDIQRGVFSKESVPAMVGAFSLQIGLFALLAGYQKWAAPLFAGGVACWTWVSITRGAYLGQKRTHWLHRVLSGTAVLLFSIGLVVARVEIDPGAIPTGGSPAAGNRADPGWLEATRDELRNLINPPPPKLAANPVAAGRRAPVRIAQASLEPDQLGKDGIPGLILQPNKKRPQSLALPRAYRLRVTLDPQRPVSIPFTGEYHLFRESSAQLPPGSEERPGSPMDAVYVTTNGTPMETDAYQEFDPPVDFSFCARIQMTLISAEAFPASATLILIGAESVGELGPEIFGMSSQPEERLEFAVPAAASGHAVKGIRIVFRHNPMEASHSTQVAVQRFTFLPKGL